MSPRPARDPVSSGAARGTVRPRPARDPVSPGPAPARHQTTPANPADSFVALSAALTGFQTVDLWGTGQVRPYLDELVQVVGEPVVAELLATGERALDSSDPEAELEKLVLNDADLGPVARRVIILWYLGQWSPLGNQWRNRHGANPLDIAHVLSAQAYVSGLVWTAIGAHPMGANPGGYGSWATPPAPSGPGSTTTPPATTPPPRAPGA